MASPRSLWPREHGAYAQLAAPLGAALASRSPSVAGALLAVAACLAFLANEPLLVVLGHRGARRREQDGVRAGRRLAIAALGAVLAGGLGLGLASTATTATLAIAAVAAVPAGAVIVLAWRRAEHTLPGELVAAVALTGAAAPVVVADGAAPRLALATWAAWAIGFSCTVIAVHRVIARHRRPAAAIDRILASALAAVAVVGCVAAVSLVPLAGLAAALVAWPPPASRLRAIGVALVGAALASGALVVATS